MKCGIAKRIYIKVKSGSRLLRVKDEPPLRVDTMFSVVVAPGSAAHVFLSRSNDATASQDKKTALVNHF